VPPAARSSRLLAACGDGVARYPIRYLWGREGAVVNTCVHGVARYPIRYQREPFESNQSQVHQGSSGLVRVRQGSSGLIGLVRVRQGSSGLVRARQGSSGSSGFVRVRQGYSGRAPIELPLALKSFVRRGAKPLSAHTDGTSGRSYVPAAGRRSARRFRVEDAREGRVVLFAHPAREVDLIPVGKVRRRGEHMHARRYFSRSRRER
jgi:hypothetical protein